MSQAPTPAGPITLASHSSTVVHRVGYRPDAWRWTPWQYATNGRFGGRWDDPAGVWRTLYVGDTRLACYLEVLACMRPDPTLTADLAAIDDEDEDALLYPTQPPGVIPRAWCDRRIVASGALYGEFVLIGDMHTLATLRRGFRPLAIQMGLDDLDAAAIRDARPRALTQRISASLYPLTTRSAEPVTGVEFSSRHADNRRLWAIYERPEDPDITPAITPAPTHDCVDPTDPELVDAMVLLDLHWAD
ncbi:RES domain-containing protein [Gordonia sp. DT218]|uniref:RES domain-containing protein n=1 Tax=Gordonia sp. DT218 TaxID=3416659 RepID=UPI003CE85B27